MRQILYVFTAGIQEFLARSVIQGNLNRIIITKHTSFVAIVLSSLIFAALHIHFGFLFMVGAAILAGLEGLCKTAEHLRSMDSPLGIRSNRHSAVSD